MAAGLIGALGGAVVTGGVAILNNRITVKANERDADKRRQFEASQRAEERSDARFQEQAKYRDDWHRELRTQMYAATAEFSGHLNSALTAAYSLRIGEVSAAADEIDTAVGQSAGVVGRIRMLFAPGSDTGAKATWAQYCAENMLNPIKALAALEADGVDVNESGAAGQVRQQKEAAQDEATKAIREFDEAASAELWQRDRQPSNGTA